MKLPQLQSTCLDAVEKIYQLYLNQDYPDEKLQQAMVYAVQNGGKKIRPLLVFAVGSIFLPEKNLFDLAAPAAAIELIHTYSLIHDDLPAMDNSDLRRGKPSCHKAFNEAIAILAGDALQPLAFQILASHPSNLSPSQRLAMINLLSDASGINGMAAGQSMDLAGGNAIAEIELMYRLKTGALITACVQIALIACDIEDKKITQALQRYIENIGFAFQIQDDLLDIIGNAELTGKPIGIDEFNKKFTYPNLVGIEASQKKITELFDNAIMAVDDIGKNAEILRELAYYLLKRNK